MYPATEIALHLAHIWAAQRQASATPRAAIRACVFGANLPPLPQARPQPRRRTRHALSVADTLMRLVLDV